MLTPSADDSVLPKEKYLKLLKRWSMEKAPGFMALARVEHPQQKK
jgi:hypothetical protein